MATMLINARCYLTLVVETILELKKKMIRQHREILRLTPFAHFMDVMPVMQERGVLGAILQVYNKIGESMLPFKVEDVELILGLRCDGDIVSSKYERV